MNKLLAATALAAVLFAATALPALARLQFTISDGTQTFSCFDGEASCDTNGGTGALSIINPFTDGTDVTFTLTQSQSGKPDELQLSSSGISTTLARTITFVASDTGFSVPVTSIKSSASLTFNANIPDATDSTLKFWADTANTQGANPTNTPGALLQTVSGHAVTDPDSFSGSKIDAFLATSPFSMTEGASLNLIAGGSITGFNQSEISSSIPEPRTWVMGVIGFGLLGLVSMRKAKQARFAI